MKINCVIICGNKSMDNFMHASGTFEPFKAYATINNFEITFAEAQVNEKVLIDNLVKGLTSQGERVVAAFIPDNPNGAYRDESIKTISDGKQWILLDKVLEAYKFKNNEKMS